MVQLSTATAIGGSIFGFTCGGIGSVCSDLAQGNDVDWAAAVSWAMAGAISGAVSGGIVPEANAAGQVSMIETAIVNGMLGTLTGGVVGTLAGDSQRILKNNLLNSAGGTLTAGDVDVALWLFDDGN